MTKIINFFKSFKMPSHKSQIEAYLADSKDIFELENKMKVLKYKGYWI